MSDHSSERDSERGHQSSRRPSSVMSVDSDGIIVTSTSAAARGFGSTALHHGGDDPFQFPSSPHTPMRSSVSACRQKQWNSSMKEKRDVDHSLSISSSFSNKRIRLAVQAPDRVGQANTTTSNGGESTTGRTLSLSQLSISRPRVASVPDHPTTPAALRQVNPVKRQMATEFAPATAVPLKELTRVAFSFATKQAQGQAKMQMIRLGPLLLQLVQTTYAAQTTPTSHGAVLVVISLHVDVLQRQTCTEKQIIPCPTALALPPNSHTPSAQPRTGQRRSNPAVFSRPNARPGHHRPGCLALLSAIRTPAHRSLFADAHAFRARRCSCRGCAACAGVLD
ncbi:hypothetical protein BCR44DRAFT_242597 [Catenaria anguillulae PL171]|uniref:Uncharacterized protein n=1 Tax=Catenaria anguillulae PL171 TaxID=765915 RepID=A0A1Y2HU79_9FUNG|nr:hypothetical protein BCR44DRAFT_242597 [Catenaria anguillulae PL171]